jgi:putative oxidoreductase
VQRLFSTFPDGWPGIGLLLLRAGAALVLLAQGMACFAGGSVPRWGTLAVGAVAVLSGSLLLIGLMTPVAGALAALDIAGIALGWLPSPLPHGLGPGLAGAFPVIVAMAIALLGPGAISVDAALFGRREIKIPPLRGPARDE